MGQHNKEVERQNTIRLMAWESLIALRSGGVRIALIVFSLLMFLAVVLGVFRTQERQNASRKVEDENTRVKQLFREVLEGDSSAGSVSSMESASPRLDRLKKQLRMSARSPYLISHATNLWDVSLLPSPLSLLSVGASRKWPSLYRVHGVSPAKTVQRSDRVRPIASVYGPFDVAFVVIVIAPLVVIGLTFNVSSRDRESGLQNLTVAQTRSLGKLMAIRCFVRAALVIGAIFFLVNGSLLFVFNNQLDSSVLINLAIWNLSVVAYLCVWGAMALFVNSFGRSSAANGAALLLMWLLLVLLIPAIVSEKVQGAVATRPEDALVDREKVAFEKASERADEFMEQYMLGNPEIEVDLDDEQQMTLAKYLLANGAVGKQAAELVLSHYSAQSSRADYLDFLSWVSPAISFRNQSIQCSGNSERVFVAFAAHAANVQAQIASVFLRPSIANEECTIEIIEELPDLQESGISTQTSLSGSARSIAVMLVWLIALLVVGLIQFRIKIQSREPKELSREKGIESA